MHKNSASRVLRILGAVVMSAAIRGTAAVEAAPLPECLETFQLVVDPQPPRRLWPPNHRYVTFDVVGCIGSAALRSSCDGSTTPIDPASLSTSILSITSTEPEDDAFDRSARGDGRTCGDMAITGPTTFALRRERSGAGDGRVYTVTFQATYPPIGTMGLGMCQFVVAHSLREALPPPPHECRFCVGPACPEDCPSTACGE
jgi:hypothetical protein